MSYIISRPIGGAAGIGHQAHNWLVAWQMASRYGLRFVHSPFIGDRTQPQIDVPCKEWENFLNFGKGELLEKDLPKNIKRIKLPFIEWDESSWETVTSDREEWADLINKHHDDNVLFECAFNQFITTNWENLIPNYHILRHKYLFNKENIKCNYYPKMLNVAINIRRGDVTKDGRYKVRWLDDEYYINVMRKLQDLFPKDIMFWIYTDGSENDIRMITDLKIWGNKIKVFPWGSNVFETFHSMVCADILVVGKSTFSVLAGLLSHGKKIAYPWSPHCNFLSKEFVKADENGNFDSSELLI